MLFNSYEFIFAFLPATLVGFHVFRKINLAVALGWLIAVSLVFYAWWRPVNVLIIVPSILVNFALAKLMLRYADNPQTERLRKGLLALGVSANLLFLGYFKYLTFFQTTANSFFGTDFVITYIILPLGISFITFQKIAFLVDVHGGKIKTLRFREFALFVLFFPQLIAGPIVHFREMMPQYRELGRRLDRQMLAVGLTLFVFGLFKKVILADGIATHVTPIFAAAEGGENVSMLLGWLAAFGFTLQIYFDFSGYSDMAAGLALAIGVRLPVNFDSPLRAANIIDFWARWHVTLTRFLTAYVYNPLAMHWTRKRLKSGRSGYSPARPRLSAFIQLLAVPTIFTMLLSGLWHGAGFTFIIWGGLHGVYLCINHAWRLYAQRRFSDRAAYDHWMRPLGIAITFLGVAVTMVWFRADSVSAAMEILAGMTGLNGIDLPAQLAAFGGLDRLSWIHVMPLSLREFLAFSAWVTCLLTVAMVLPNSLQVLVDQRPVLDFKLRDEIGARIAQKLPWRPSLPWFVATAICLVSAIMLLGGQSEFLYWQF